MLELHDLKSLVGILWYFDVEPTWFIQDHGYCSIAALTVKQRIPECVNVCRILACSFNML